MDEEAEIEIMRKRAAELGLVIVAPYEIIVVEGEGADEEFQLIPTRQIETYREAIRQLKASTPSVPR